MNQEGRIVAGEEEEDEEEEIPQTQSSSIKVQTTDHCVSLLNPISSARTQGLLSMEKSQRKMMTRQCKLLHLDRSSK